LRSPPVDLGPILVDLRRTKIDLRGKWVDLRPIPVDLRAISVDLRPTKVDQFSKSFAPPPRVIGPGAACIALSWPIGFLWDRPCERAIRVC